MPRFTVDFGENFDKLLTDLAAEKQTTKAEIIRRAVASYAVLNQNTSDGKKVSITDERDRVIKDIVLP